MTPTASELRAWMASTGRGYKAAARHFKISRDRVRALASSTASTASVDRPDSNARAGADAGADASARDQVKAAALAAMREDAATRSNGIPHFVNIAERMKISKADLWRWWTKPAEQVAASPWVAVRSSPDTRLIVRAPNATALAAIGTLKRGCALTGINKGQFSLLDILLAVLSSTGPAHVVISTWSTGIRDAETAAWLVNEKRILSLRILTNDSFPVLKPRYAERILQLFGPQGITVTNTHAKFFTVQNEEWNICVRSSMNFNKNPHLEQFDIDDDRGVCELFLRVVDECVADVPPGLHFARAAVDEAFKAARLGATAPEAWESAEDPIAGALPTAGAPSTAAPTTESALDAVAYWSRRVDMAGKARRDALLRKQGSAAATWEKLAQAARVKLDEAQAATITELDFDESLLPREEFERRLLLACEGLGDRDFELLLGAYAERNNGRLLFVGSGGHRAELVDSAWVIEASE